MSWGIVRDVLNSGSYCVHCVGVAMKMCSTMDSIKTTPKKYKSRMFFSKSCAYNKVVFY